MVLDFRVQIKRKRNNKPDNLYENLCECNRPKYKKNENKNKLFSYKTKQKCQIY